MQLTKRDKAVIEFIKDNPCRADSLQKLFYPSQRVANRRLSFMTDYKYIRRYRENINSYYFYYVGRKPKQVEHMDLVVKAMIWIKAQGYSVIKFRREVKLNGIRPDAVAAIQRGDKTGILMIEIERFNNSLKKKISLYDAELEEKKHFSSFKILYVCNAKVNHHNVICISPKDLL